MDNIIGIKPFYVGHENMVPLEVEIEKIKSEKKLCDGNTPNFKLTIHEDYENGGEHIWLIFHYGEINGNLPELIDKLIEKNDERIW